MKFPSRWQRRDFYFLPTVTRAPPPERFWIGFGRTAGLFVLLVACERQPPPLEVAVPSSSRGTAGGSALKSAIPPAPTAKLPSKSKEQLSSVSLGGEYLGREATLAAPGHERVYSRARRTWIYKNPSDTSAKLGYLRGGASAPIAKRLSGGGPCAGQWVELLIRGHVCVGPNATLDSMDPVVAALAASPPNFANKLPYRYGTVRKPGPIFSRLAHRQELRDLEPGYEERLPRWLDASGQIGASYGQEVWSIDAPSPRQAWETRSTAGVPSFLQNLQSLPRFGRSGARSAPSSLPRPTIVGRMLPRSGHAFVDTFLWEGRRYGLSTRLELMPTDRFRPIRGSDFHGYEIGKDVAFPFALVRSIAAKYRDGTKAVYRAALALTGKQRFYGKVLHYQTEEGKWISDRYASRLDPAKKMPGWGKKGERWIDINLSKQTLMLYEGTKPVFATLISSGEAGLADHEQSTATKRGIFRIHTKHVTTTMSSEQVGEEFELSDVPYVQYYDTEGYALHGAYWHDRFGMPKSHGCINLSPEDARRVFHWTNPPLPLGWHGVLLPLRGTVVFIHA